MGLTWGSLADPFTFFHPVPLPSSRLTAVSLFHESLPLCLFCSSVQFVHSIPHMSEIVWCLSLSDWLISLSVLISTSTHAVEKGTSSFQAISLNTEKKNNNTMCPRARTRCCYQAGSWYSWKRKSVSAGAFLVSKQPWFRGCPQVLTARDCLA